MNILRAIRLVNVLHSVFSDVDIYFTLKNSSTNYYIKHARNVINELLIKCRKLFLYKVLFYIYDFVTNYKIIN